MTDSTLTLPTASRDTLRVVSCDASMFYTMLPSSEVVIAVFGKPDNKRTDRALRVVLAYLDHYPSARYVMWVKVANAKDAKDVQVVRVPQVRVYRNGSELGVVVGVPTFDGLHEHLR